ncbi:MAG: hypothetical protein IT463_04335 [Planctomycetes bacterium]|nr:hypothetical protein [Planctomycetota bacterium]
MAIIYYVDFPCPIKDAVKPGRLLRLLYARERANEAVNRARKEKPDISPEEVMVALSLKDKERTAQLVQTSAAEVQRQFGELDALAHHCRDCRARVETGSFGCRGRIDLPISLKAEAFLMGLIHGSGGDPTPGLLANYMENNGIAGNRPAEMRKLPGVWFESDKPLVKRLPDERRISANQLFELLFLISPIRPNHARFLLGMLDVLAPNLPLDRPLESLPNLFVVERADAGLVTARVGLKLQAGADDDASLRGLQNYFGALLLGSELGCEVTIKV